MQTIPERITVPVAVALRSEQQISNAVYQGTTLAAMLWLLISLWVF